MMDRKPALRRSQQQAAVVEEAEEGAVVEQLSCNGVFQRA